MTHWRAVAACHRDRSPVEPHTFDADYLPGETDLERDDRHAVAGLVCKGCPVQQACLDDALADPEREGYYAGYVIENERTDDE